MVLVHAKAWEALSSISEPGFRFKYQIPTMYKLYTTWGKRLHWQSPVNHDSWHPLVQFSCSVVSDSLRPHGLQHAKLPCPSPTLGVYSISCPWSQWCHPAISSSVRPFFSCFQSFPTPGSFPMSQLFASSGQSIGVSVSATVLPMNIQDWSPLG